MTREEAIKRVKGYLIDCLPADCYNEICEIIEVLDQDSIVDKIRTEVAALTYYWCEVNPHTVIEDVLEIIDKYKQKVR